MTTLESGPAGRALDALLEATVAGSFSRIGYDVRHRVFGWEEPVAGSMLGQVAVVTGATGGLGAEISSELARLGAKVWLLGRDEQRTNALAARIRADFPAADLSVAVADLARLSDVRRVADMLLGRADRIDALVHNAGTLMSRYEVTADGLETATQIHVVAPFLLTSLLFPLLHATPGACVITVSSGGMYTKRLDVDALTPDPASYDGVAAYAMTKRAQVVLTQEWARRSDGSGIAFHAMHPGWVRTPGLLASLPRFGRLLGPVLRSPQQGADTVVWLAHSATGEQGSGRFWHDRSERSTSRLPRTATPAGESERLWEFARTQAGLSPRQVGRPPKQAGPTLTPSVPAVHSDAAPPR